MTVADTAAGNFGQFSLSPYGPINSYALVQVPLCHDDMRHYWGSLHGDGDCGRPGAYRRAPGQEG